MKTGTFKLQRLDHFVAAKEVEAQDSPLTNTPFGLSREGSLVGPWEINYRRIEIYTSSAGKKLISNDELILITVPPTETGIEPLAKDQQFGWNGKINESLADQALWWAFEFLTEEEANLFMKTEHPIVIFNYIDSEGQNEITVKHNGEFWVIQSPDDNENISR